MGPGSPSGLIVTAPGLRSAPTHPHHMSLAPLTCARLPSHMCSAPLMCLATHLSCLCPPPCPPCMVQVVTAQGLTAHRYWFVMHFDPDTARCRCSDYCSLDPNPSDSLCRSHLPHNCFPPLSCSPCPLFPPGLYLRCPLCYIFGTTCARVAFPAPPFKALPPQVGGPERGWGVY